MALDLGQAIADLVDGDDEEGVNIFFDDDESPRRTRQRDRSLSPPAVSIDELLGERKGAGRGRARVDQVQRERERMVRDRERAEIKKQKDAERERKQQERDVQRLAKEVEREEKRVQRQLEREERLQQLKRRQRFAAGLFPGQPIAASVWEEMDQIERKCARVDWCVFCEVVHARAYVGGQSYYADIIKYFHANLGEMDPVTLTSRVQEQLDTNIMPFIEPAHLRSMVTRCSTIWKHFNEHSLSKRCIQEDGLRKLTVISDALFSNLSVTDPDSGYSVVDPKKVATWLRVHKERVTIAHQLSEMRSVQENAMSVTAPIAR